MHIKRSFSFCRLAYFSVQKMVLGENITENKNGLDSSSFADGRSLCLLDF